MASRGIASRSLIINRVRERESRVFDREHELRPHHRQLDALYEKIYFHEIDGRDKVTQRLQLPLVAFLAIAGFVGSLIQNVRRADTSLSADVFLALLVLAVVALTLAMVFFVASLTGKKYLHLQAPEDWVSHQAECTDLYREYDHAGKLTSAALTKNLVATYVLCGTVNGAINAKKAFYLFMLLRCLIAGACFTAFAFGVFFAAKLDKNLTKVTHRVEIVSPLTLKGVANVVTEATATTAATARPGDQRGSANSNTPSGAAKAKDLK